MQRQPYIKHEKKREKVNYFQLFKGENNFSYFIRILPKNENKDLWRETKFNQNIIKKELK